MLSLIRRPSESIRIVTAEGVIELTISDIQRDQAQIAIEAPKSIKILRSEMDLPPPTSKLRFLNFLSDK